MKSAYRIGIVTVAVVAIASWLLISNSNKSFTLPYSLKTEAEPANPRSGTGNFTIQDTTQGILQWLETYQKTPPPEQPKLLKAGTALAMQRREQIAELIQKDPERALENAIGYAAYEALPAPIRALTERPFTKLADLMVLPSEPTPRDSKLPPAPEQVILRLKGESEHYGVTLYGNRKNTLSKDGLPVQGIQLDGFAAVADQPVQRVEGPDRNWALQNLEPLSTAHQRDFFTGETLPDTPVIGILGGRILYFANANNLAKLNDALLELEAIPGPQNGAQQLLHPVPMEHSNSQAVAFVERMEVLVNEARSWTTTPKRVFFIRLDFPDLPGEPIAQGELEQELDQNVSPVVREYAHGRTWLESQVSGQLVRLPRPVAEYTTNDEFISLANNAISAFAALGTGIDLADFDIVGFYFANIGMPWTGRATLGGSWQWIQGSSSTGLFVHEFGHNYGLNHAGLWQTDDSSVVGSGSNVEYGDRYDEMGSGLRLQGADSAEPHFHMQSKAKLNWLTPAQWTNVSQSGQYRVHSFDQAEVTGNSGVRVRKSSEDFYWLGLRQKYLEALPRREGDESIKSDGLYIIWERQDLDRSLLLDMTPDSEDDDYLDALDAVLPVGRTFSDPTAGVHITPLALHSSDSSKWVNVAVNLGQFPDNRPPAATIEAPSNASARDPVLLVANASDPDNDPLAFYWDTGDDTAYPSSPTISPKWNASGTYSITLVVSDMKGGSSTVTHEVNVDEPLAGGSITTPDAPNGASAIATDGEKLIIVSRPSQILSSTNGLDWSKSQAVSPEYFDASALTYAEGRWVLVGSAYDSNLNEYAGAIFTSEDGETWTKRLNSGEHLRSVTGSSFGFVAVGSAGRVAFSPSGITWTEALSGTSLQLDSVASGDGHFVAVGYDFGASTSTLIRSANGVDWTSTPIREFDFLRKVRFLDNKFFVLGLNFGLQYSSDYGESFSRATLQNNLSDARPYYWEGDLEYGNGIFFLAGESEKYDEDLGSWKYLKVNWFSENGEAWTPTSAPDLRGSQAVEFFQNRFYAVGEDGHIWRSPLVPNYAATATLNVSVSEGGKLLSSPAGIDCGSDCIQSYRLGTFVQLSGMPLPGYSVSYQSASCLQAPGCWIQMLNDTSIFVNFVALDTDKDGLPDPWEIANGTDPMKNDAYVDSDDDGFSNFEEYLQGTDPKDAKSYPIGTPGLNLILLKAALDSKAEPE